MRWMDKQGEVACSGIILGIILIVCALSLREKTPGEDAATVLRPWKQIDTRHWTYYFDQAPAGYYQVYRSVTLTVCTKSSGPGYSCEVSVE